MDITKDDFTININDFIEIDFQGNCYKFQLPNTPDSIHYKNDKEIFLHENDEALELSEKIISCFETREEAALAFASGFKYLTYTEKDDIYTVNANDKLEGDQFEIGNHSDYYNIIYFIKYFGDS